MLPSFAQSHDWLYSDPLLFDDEFCQSLMKDLQSLPTPPQSPPTKAGVGSSKPLSNEDQLSYVSDILLEDHDMQLGWNFFDTDVAEKGSRRSRPEETEDGLWGCFGGDKVLEEKLVSSVLGSSPLLSDIDTSIFEEIAGSTLDCHAVALGSQDLVAREEQSESTSDYGSVGGELSTYSSSDSEEEIDVVTVVRCLSSPSPLPPLAEPSVRQQRRVEEQRARQRHHYDIHLQHNYAAPCPDSPPPPSAAAGKRSRGDSSVRLAHASVRPCASSRQRQPEPSRLSAETEDEEERRRTHNVMERQRRNELKNCFLRLRDNVPELSHNDKASKVVILKRAEDSIRSLEAESRRLQRHRDKLRCRQERLTARLEQLRS